jgi:predicted polyphosphate/ATP-dependent NAD kinase
MALTSFGFIVTGSDFDPATDVSVMETRSFRMTTIGVSTADQGPAAAQRLVADGVQLIELCGGFGPVWTARVIEAIDDAVPVGSVAYGPEAIDRVHEIFA